MTVTFLAAGDLVVDFGFPPSHSPFNYFPLLLLLDLDLLVLFHLQYALLLCLQSTHLLMESAEIELLALFISLLLLQLIVLFDVSDQRRYYHLGLHVITQETPRSYLVTTRGTLFLHLTIVILDALTTKFVQTLLHIQWVLVNISANWT